MKINMKSKSVTLATKGCYCPEDVEIEAKMQEKTVAQNGEVVADSGFAGLSKVTVAVPEPDAKIIDVDELPTADIDDRVYYRMDGKLYKYKPETAVGTWVLNETISVPDEEVLGVKASVKTQYFDGQSLWLINSKRSGLTGALTSYFTIAKGETISSGTLAFYKDGTSSGWTTSGKIAQVVSTTEINYLENTAENRTFTVTDVSNEADISYLVKWLKANATRQGASGEGWECYLVPDGSVTIAENGTVDVTDKKEVVVNVEGSGDKLWAYLNLTTLHINQAESFTQSGTSLEVNV